MRNKRRKNKTYRIVNPPDSGWAVTGWLVDQYEKKIGLTVMKDGTAYICYIHKKVTI